MTNNYLKGSQQTFITLGVGTIIAIITSIIVTRALGPSGRGEYAIILSTISIIMSICQCGLPEAMLYQLGKSCKNLSKLAINNFLFIFLATIILIITFYLLLPYIEKSLLNNINNGLIWTSIMIIPFNLTIILFNRLNQLNNQLSLYNTINLANHILFFIFVSLFLVFLSKQSMTVIVALLLSRLIIAVIVIAIAMKSLIGNNWQIDFSLLKESILSGLKVQWGMIFYTIGLYCNIYIINHYLDLEKVGYYALAVGLASYMKLIPETLRTVLQSWMPKLSNSNVNIIDKTIYTTRFTIILMIFYVMLIIIFGQAIIKIAYGSVFLPAYTPLLIIMIGVVFQGVGQILVSQLVIGGYLNFASLAATLGAFISLIFSWYMVPTLGINGAAISLVINHFIHGLIIIIMIKKTNNMKISDLIPRYDDFKRLTLILFNLFKDYSLYIKK